PRRAPVARGAGGPNPPDFQRCLEPGPEARDGNQDEVPVEACEDHHRATQPGAAALAAAPTPLRHGQIVVTSLPTGYANEFFGRGTLSMKSGTSRAGALARRIFTNSSRFFMYRIAALTQLSIAVSPLRMPIPHGTFRNLSPVSLRVGSCVATPSRKASSNMKVSARPSFTADTASAGESTSSSFEFLKQFLVHAA